MTPKKPKPSRKSSESTADTDDENTSVNDPDYFLNQYDSIRYPVEKAGQAGLRQCQLGATHALAGFLSMNRSPGLIVMPTGSGKTGVLMAAPFVQRAKRVLVVTPSRLVRNQIAEGFADLGILRRLGVVSDAVPNPNVIELKNQITSIDRWNELAEFNVIVT